MDSTVATAIRLTMMGDVFCCIRGQHSRLFECFGSCVWGPLLFNGAKSGLAPGFHQAAANHLISAWLNHSVITSHDLWRASPAGLR
jgi:hypothetical protein